MGKFINLIYFKEFKMFWQRSKIYLVRISKKKINYKYNSNTVIKTEKMRSSFKFIYN